MGWLRLAAFLAFNGLLGLLLPTLFRSIAGAVLKMNGGNGSVSMPPSWLLSAAQFAGVFLLTLAAAIFWSLRSSAGSFRSLARMIRDDA